MRIALFRDEFGDHYLGDWPAHLLNPLGLAPVPCLREAFADLRRKAAATGKPAVVEKRGRERVAERDTRGWPDFEVRN